MLLKLFFQLANYFIYVLLSFQKLLTPYLQKFIEIGLKINFKKLVTFLLFILPADCTKRRVCQLLLFIEYKTKIYKTVINPQEKLVI